MEKKEFKKLLKDIEKKEPNLKNMEEIKKIATAPSFDISDDPELKSIRKLKEGISIDNIKLATLYVKCHHFLELYCSYFKEFSTDLRVFIDEFEIEKIRGLVIDYKYGEEFGDYLTEEKINLLINKNRKEYQEFIKVFFDVFGIED